MRYNIRSLIMIICIILCTGCTKESSTSDVGYKSIVDYNANELEIVNSDAAIEGPKRNFKELSEYANIIVKATIIGNYEEIPQYDDNGVLLLADTKVDIQIDEIYKDTSSSIHIGDVLQLIESYFIVNETYSDKTSADILVTIDNYLPSIEGEEYVFFLNQAYNGEDKDYIFYDMYYPISLSYGRFKLSNSKKNHAKFTLSNDYKKTQGDDIIYKEVFNQVLNAYDLNTDIE